MQESNSRLINFSLNDDPLNRWGLRQIHERQLEEKTWASFHVTHLGAGVDIYMVDSGISEKHLEFIHPQQKAQRIHLLYDAFGGDGHDELGHGTYIASLLVGRNVGVAPLADVWSVKVFAQNFETRVDNILRGLESVLNHHKNKNNGRPSVLNASWCVDLDQQVDKAIRLLVEAGVVVVAAAGTGNCSVQKISPAASAEVITVGATTRARTILLHCAEPSSEKLKTVYSGDRLISNYGPGIDILAPGEAIFGADSKNPSGYLQLSGSSAAAAYVSGVVACLLEENPKLNPFQLRERLLLVATTDMLPQDTCRELSLPNKFLFQPLQKMEPRWQVEANSLLAIVEPEQQIDIVLPCASTTGDHLMYELIGGKLPQGLVLQSDGRIVGSLFNHSELDTTKKVDPESFDFTVKAIDRNGESHLTLALVVVPKTHYSNSDLHAVRFARVAKSPAPPISAAPAPAPPAPPAS